MFYGRVLNDLGHCVAQLGPYDNVYYLTEDLLSEVPGSHWSPDYEMTVWMEEA